MAGAVSGTSAWFTRTSATFGNNANPPSPAPAISYSNPSTQLVYVTDPAGRTWIFSLDPSGRLVGVQRPGSSSANITYAYGADGTVSSATKDGVTNTYSRSVVGSTATETLTDPLTNQTVLTADLNAGRPTSVRDPLNHTTSYTYDGNARLTNITAPEGNYVQYGYDARGNVTSTTSVAKSGSGLANIVTSANFDATCANIVKCNKPNSMTDARNNTTNYTYDPTHGGVLTITQPAPTAGAVQPQTRYTYTQVTSASGNLVYMLTGVSGCQTSASCTGTSDESKASASYNSNLLPTSVSRGDGTGALTATTSATYDSHGNVSTVTGPLGTAQTAKYRYDAADQLIGVTSPSPGNGQPDRASRITYRPDGQISREELGTVTDQSDTAWANFATAQEVDIGYDSNSRPNTQLLMSGGTTYAYTHQSYDALGRPDCTAVRMNPAVYNSLPGACTLSTQGSYGPDRISKRIYDAAGQLTQIQVAVGSSDAANERTLTYNPNGTVATLTDGNNNATSYTYDGFDRLSKTTYPGGSTDQVTLYDPNGNVNTRVNRAGQSFSFTYDALNRFTSKSGAVPQVNYSYDNLNRMLTATFASGGQGITNGYDALSRLTSSTSNMDGTSRSLNSGYDLADHRTSLTGDSGYGAWFGYFTTGELGSSTDSTGATIVSISLDSLGRRSALGLGVNNTSWAGYGYDVVSRLTSIARRFAVTGSDANLTFAYNPASQITSQTRDNDAYAWNGAVNVNRSYAANGLNQYTSAGSASYTYDANGNLTSDGTNTFSYDAENHMVSATTAGVTTSLSYDPIGRLWRIVKGSSETRFLYDGDHVAMEFDGSGNLLRSYVRGTGADEPLVWYEGSGTSNRRFLSSDERGSVVAVMDGSGNRIALNSYDEYGLPGSANQGRFQYTGQAWLSEIGMYYYKARMYSPTLGRFMQTDPIGYGDGPNWYAYAHNDPVNNVDPTGLTPPAVNPQPIVIVHCQWTCPAPVPGVITIYGGYLGGNGTAAGGSQDPNSDPITITGHRSGKPAGSMQPPPNAQNACGGAKAAGIAKALDYTGMAHEGFKGIAKLGGGGEAAERALGPIGYALAAAESVAAVFSSVGNGEPVDVAIVRGGAPVLVGASGALWGGIVGGIAGGAAGSVVPILGNGVGAAAGGVAGVIAGGVGGEKLGEADAEAYAGWRGYGKCN